MPVVLWNTYLHEATPRSGSSLSPLTMMDAGKTELDDYIPVICIGAGFSGVCLGVQLQRQLGFTAFHLYDELKEFGGTWCANTYPGVHLPTASPRPLTDRQGVPVTFLSRCTPFLLLRILTARQPTLLSKSSWRTLRM